MNKTFFENSLGGMKVMITENKMTGYPSIDKPWLKYYSEEAISVPLPECTIYEYLWECNKEYLGDIAINYYDRKITYGEMFRNIENATRAFSAIGIEAGDIIVMTTITTPETIYAFYALNRLGAIANMVDPRTSIEGIKEYIIEVNAKYVLTVDVAYSKIEKAIRDTEVERVIVTSPADSLAQPKRFLYNLSNNIGKSSVVLNDKCINWSDFTLRGKGTNLNDVTYKKNTCCAIVHTGGTTGMPKGVMLSNENFNEMVTSFTYNGLSFERGNVFLSIMPPFIAYGIVNGIHVVLCRGMQIVLLPSVDQNKLASLILKYKPTHMLATPTHFSAIMNSKVIKESTDLSFIKMIGMGGDGLHVDTEKRLNVFFEKHKCHCSVIKGYGMTEVSAAACASHPSNNISGSVGLPFGKISISAFKPETDQELRFREKGEICILSPSTMLGYYNNVEETDKILKKHSDGNKWIHSGDIGYVDYDGNVFIEGRIKRMIIRYDGFKVFPFQIEQAVLKHNGIDSCCAVSGPDKEHTQGKLPVVFVVKKQGYENSEVDIKQELVELCNKELPEYAQPISYVFCEKLPLTSIGKVDYRELEKKAEELLL